MFTDTEKANIRRHCGYPAFGNAATQHFGVRFMQSFGSLEYKLQNLSDPEEAIVRAYLTQLDQLETDVFGVRENADTNAAAVWERNPRELGERLALYTEWRLKLCNYFDIPPGSDIARSGSGRMVV